jgi:autotransporter adhesin
LGSGSIANNANDVALGSNSTTSATVATTGTMINGAAYTFAGTAPGSTVSVGAAGSERTITNVAAGRISAISTDAVNGSELNATNQAVGTLGTTVTTLGTTVTTLGNTVSRRECGDWSRPELWHPGHYIQQRRQRFGRGQH